MSLYTKTENGAKAVASVNPLLTLFYRIGASRSNPNILNDFFNAFKYDEIKALAILLWARCIRGRGEAGELSGAGERKVFREILHSYLKEGSKGEIILSLIPLIGRYDDLRAAFGTKYQKFASILWAEEIRQKNVLAAKWADRSDKPLQKAFKTNEAGLRKLLSGIRKDHIVENKICSKDFESIEYNKLPSLAALRYVGIFKKWDAERFDAFISSKETKVNASVTMPHEVFTQYRINRDSEVASKFWNAIPKLETKGNILCMVDTSGSMTMPVSDNSKTYCIDVSIALGVYLAQNNTGTFRNKLLTFSHDPTFVSLPQNKNIGEIFSFVHNINWGMNTDFSKAYTLLLNLAVKEKVDPKDMPEYLLCLSDMQFDQATVLRRYDYSKRQYIESEPLAMNDIRNKFIEAGYKAPKIIFWNLRTSNGFPSAEDTPDVALVSGFNPDILKAVLKAEYITPVDVMEKAINPFVSLLLAA